jgi:chromosomal replication initiator protein
LRRGAELSEFVVYPGNEHAVMAVRMLLQDNERSPRCIYVYGGVGLGKSHVAESAYRQWRRIRPDRPAMMLSSDAFGNAYSKALREKSLPSFRQKFRSLELLILDDVEFFDGKHGFQDELLNLLRHLLETGRRVLVTADRHPRLLSQTSEGLTSRFLSGAVARIEAPNLDARRNLVVSKARRMELSLPAEVCDYIAGRFLRDIRELEGALNILSTFISREEPVSLAAARNVLGEFERDCVRVVQLTDILDAVCQVFGVSRSDLQSERRSKNLNEPRMLAMFLARQLTRTTYQEIGRQFGGRNHSTVVAAEKKIDAAVRNRVEIQLATRTWTMDRLVDALRQRLVAG